ncbi:MAG: hypothetical protein ACJ76Y_16870 [Thermoanaerobaculia bacterium]
MSRSLLCALLLALAPAAVHATCYPPTNGAANQPTADYVYLVPNSAMSAAAPNALSAAASMWQGCSSSSASFDHPGFPYPTTTPVSGAPFAQLNVAYHTGFHPTNNRACAAFPGPSGGNYVDVYQQAYDASGNIVQCSSFGYDQIIAHELGHYYHLGDIFDPGCSDIMAQLDGTPHSISSGDCTEADNQNNPYHENYPVDPSCQQPCYTTCVSGQCPALNGGSPILLDLDGGGFRLSGPQDPVRFDLFNNGQPVWTAWTARGSGTSFLALDLNHNGGIDDAGELFGNHTRLVDGSFAPTGYDALTQYDELANGGDANGVIDAQDAVFFDLRIWTDWNHNGKTDPGELRTLSEAGITSISLEHRLVRRLDRYGNQFLLRGRALWSNGRRERPVPTYDVYFVQSKRP